MIRPDAGIERRAGIAGIVAFILIASQIALTAVDAPGTDATAQEVLDYFDDSKDRIMIATLLAAVTGVLVLWFLGGLRRVLLMAEGGPGSITAIGFAAGVVVVALQMAASAALVAYPAAAEFFDNFEPDATLAQVLVVFSFWLGLIANVIQIGLVGAVWVLARRTGVFGSAIAWFSLAVAFAGLLSLIFFPVGLLCVVWVLVMGIVLARRPAESVAA